MHKEDLFAREISIGVNHWCARKDCARFAGAINKVFSAYCAEAPGANKW